MSEDVDRTRAWEKLVASARADGFGYGIVWSILVGLVFLAAMESLQGFFRGDTADAWLMLVGAIAGTAAAVSIARRCLH